MRLVLLTSLTMIAFAANSVLNRMAVGPGLIDPVVFAVLRLWSGAAILYLLLARRQAGGHLRPSRFTVVGAGALLLYLFGFSLAYRALHAGAGALILFGMVQITMFAGALVASEAAPPRRWIGATLAFAGLVLLLAPGGGAVSPVHAALMAAAGVGWGVYSLAGRRAGDALAATAANFIWAVPVGTALALVLSVPAGAFAPARAGIVMAILSGAVTSGLGYALWYRILPALGATRAAVAQLTVPVIASLAGVILLGEGLGWRFLLSAALVLSGVAIAALTRGR
jgi:drug/metabolite transporter (DMT)-like permease